MSKGDLKRLGDYIREVDVRNKELECSNLLGLSISKTFIPSIANTIGTDLRNYKIVHQGQFGYVPVTSRNGEKITIALYEGQEDCIISQAYTVFEVVEPQTLLPEYLMMWFRRPEFDRYARFHSHGSAREIFDWDEMCDVMLPIPPLEEQREIVARYQAIQQRIEVNRKTIAKLEEAAQAIYRKMFVDDIDPENLPDGWRTGVLGDIVVITAGGDRPENFSEKRSSFFNIPVYSNGIDKDGLYGFTDSPKVTKDCVTVSARGTIGFVCHRDEPFVPIVRLLCFFPNERIGDSAFYTYYLLKNTHLEGDGAVQQQLTAPKVKETEIVIPAKDVVLKFDKLISPVQKQIKILKKEISCLDRITLI